MRQDDHVAEAVEKTNQFEMPLKLVPDLTDKTFKQILQQSDPAVVLLYFPCTFHHEAFLTAYNYSYPVS